MPIGTGDDGGYGRSHSDMGGDLDRRGAESLAHRRVFSLKRWFSPFAISRPGVTKRVEEFVLGHDGVSEPGVARRSGPGKQDGNPWSQALEVFPDPVDLPVSAGVRFETRRRRPARG